MIVSCILLFAFCSKAVEGIGGKSALSKEASKTLLNPSSIERRVFRLTVTEFNGQDTSYFCIVSVQFEHCSSATIQPGIHTITIDSNQSFEDLSKTKSLTWAKMEAFLFFAGNRNKFNELFFFFSVLSTPGLYTGVEEGLNWWLITDALNTLKETEVKGLYTITVELKSYLDYVAEVDSSPLPLHQKAATESERSSSTKQGETQTHTTTSKKTTATKESETPETPLESKSSTGKSEKLKNKTASDIFKGLFPKSKKTKENDESESTTLPTPDRVTGEEIY